MAMATARWPWGRASCFHWGVKALVLQAQHLHCQDNKKIRSSFKAPYLSTQQNSKMPSFGNMVQKRALKYRIARWAFFRSPSVPLEQSCCLSPILSFLLLLLLLLLAVRGVAVVRWQQLSAPRRGLSGRTPARCWPSAPPPRSRTTRPAAPPAACCSFPGTCHC